MYHHEQVISQSAMEQIENFQGEPGDHKWGKTFLFDIQIEVPNPQSLRYLAKEENAVMLQLSKEFADTLFHQLNAVKKGLGILVNSTLDSREVLFEELP